jgi:hypothetical protein
MRDSGTDPNDKELMVPHNIGSVSGTCMIDPIVTDRLPESGIMRASIQSQTAKIFNDTLR